MPNASIALQKAHEIEVVPQPTNQGAPAKGVVAEVREGADIEQVYECAEEVIGRTRIA